MKKAIINAFIRLAIVYIMASVLLSVLVSVPVEGVSKWAILHNRRPFALVEVCTTTATAENGTICGYNAFGEYISHNDTDRPGDTITTIFFYNPLTVHADDISIRIDYNHTQNTFDVWRG